MELHKKIYYLLISLFFYSFVFSFRGPEFDDFIVHENDEELRNPDRYKKNFIIDEKNSVTNFIILDKDNKVDAPFFAPKDDICGILIGLIKNEKKSIKIATFFLTEERIVTALVKAMQRGVAVEVVAGTHVVLGKYDVCAKKLDEKGAKIYAYNPPKGRNKWIRGIMHNKFIIFEQNIYKRSLVVTGSLNLTNSAFNYNKENIKITDDSEIVKKYIDNFSTLKHKWCKQYEKIEKVVPLVDGEVDVPFFSPNDDIFYILQHLIVQEKERIRMAAFFLTELDIVDALVDAMKRGVTVEIIADSNVIYGKYNSGARKLEKNGAKIFAYQPEEGIMHNKFVVFGKTVYARPLLWTGSANFTNSANNYNKENVTIFSDSKIIEQYIKEFEAIKKDCCSVYKFEKKKKKKKKFTGKLFKKSKKPLGKRRVKKRRKKRIITVNERTNNDGIFKEDRDLQHKNKKRKIVQLCVLSDR